MSRTRDDSHAGSSEALARWSEELAAGRSWSDVEDEVVVLCGGRVDLLTGLLIEAETVRRNAGAATREAYRVCA